MRAKNILTDRSVVRTIRVNSIRCGPRLGQKLSDLDLSVVQSPLKLTVEFQLRNPRVQYVTGVPRVDDALKKLGGHPTALKLSAQSWGPRPKFDDVLDLSRPTLVLVTTEGSRTVGETSEIGVRTAQVNLGRNPIIWLTW